MKPILQALLLADHVYSDASGKKIITGTFNTIEMSRFTQEQVQASQGSLLIQPTMGTPWLYLSLTDVIDQTEVVLQFVSRKNGTVLFEGKLVISCNDRLATVEVVMHLPNLPRMIPEAGIYSFDALWNGELLGSHRITARIKEPPSQSAAPGNGQAE